MSIPIENLKILMCVDRGSNSKSLVVFTILNEYTKLRELYSVEVDRNIYINNFNISDYLSKNVVKYPNLSHLVYVLVKDIFNKPIEIKNGNEEIILTDETNYLIANKKYSSIGYKFEVSDNTINFTFNYGSVLVPEIEQRVIEFDNSPIFIFEHNGNKVYLYKINPNYTIR